MPSLTDKRIQALAPPEKGRRLVFDDHRDAPRGFGVRINAGGKVSFILRYNADGKDRQINIGEYGENKWSLAAARKRAGELRREIDGGTDILEQRRAEQAELTMGEVVEKFCGHHADKLASGQDIRYALNKHLVPALGKKKIAEVRRRDVIGLVEGLARSHPRQASLLLAYTKQVLAYAEDRELIEASPIASLKPARIAPELVASKRGRILTEEELVTFWQNVETCGLNRLTALALKLTLVTGQRPGEVAGLRWEEVDGDTWTIPTSRRGKTDSAHAVPLTRTAMEILEAAREEGGGGSCVFETKAGTPAEAGHLSRAVQRFRKRLGNKPDPEWGYWRPHDLRRTMRTGLAAAGIDDLAAELTVGHTRKGIAAVYDLHKYDKEKRQALEAWERRLLRTIHGQEADNVVPLAAREP